MSEQNEQAETVETNAADDRPGHSPYRLGAGVGIVLVLASIFLFLSFFSLWANRQLFDSAQWTKTSTQVIEQPAVQDALANYMVDELFNNVNVEQEIKNQLPSDWGVLASPATSALRSLTLTGAKKVLELPVTQQAWSAANEITHKSLIALLDESGTAGVSTTSGTVTVNARTILEQAAQKLGLSGNLVSKIPPDAGKFEIWHSDNLATAQATYKTFKTFSWIFAIATILLYVLAIGLASRRRRRAVTWMGASFVVVGLLVLITVSLAKGPVVDSLAQTSSVVPAVTDVYEIATELLRRMAGSLAFTGLLVLLASLLAGPYGWAIKFREFVAPYLRDYLPAATAATALLFLIVLWLVPISGFRTAVGLSINVLLAISGFVALVLITRREFPDAEPVDVSAVGDWSREHWNRVRDFSNDLIGRDSSATTTITKIDHDAPTESLPGAADSLDQLERLQKLHESGTLSDEEFAAAKARLLKD
jgi:hypothetical protein